MEYQRVIALLDNKSNQPFKLRTRNWTEINDELRESMIIVASNLKLQW